MNDDYKLWRIRYEGKMNDDYKLWRIRYQRGGDETVKADIVEIVTGHLCFMLDGVTVLVVPCEAVKSLKQWVP